MLNLTKAIHAILCCWFLLLPMESLAGSAIEPRIYNGEDAPKKMYPFMVAIFDGKKPKNKNYICGGTLIAESVVLTSAECVHYYNNAKSLHVAIKGSKTTTTKGFEFINVTKMVVHPKFGDIETRNDIALLFLQTPSTAKPVRLHNKNVQSGNGVILGWGMLRDEYEWWDPYGGYKFRSNDNNDGRNLRSGNGPTPRSGEHSYHWCSGEHEGSGYCDPDLQMATVPIVSDKKCKKKYPDIFKKNSGQVCIGAQDSGGDICYGDEGGPMMLKGKQYGILLWFADLCNYHDRYSLITEIPKFYEWIWKTTNAQFPATLEKIGNGFCRTNLESQENGITDQGIHYRFCDADEQEGCSIKECDEKCKRDDACMGYEYWHNKNRRTGTCEIHLTPVDYFEASNQGTCHRKDATYNCSYKPLGGGFCRDADNSQGTYTRVCSIDDGLCDLKDCMDHCTNDATCTAVEHHTDRGEYTGTCDLHTGTITHVKASAEGVCYLKETTC